jgi:hypothetical protein
MVAALAALFTAGCVKSDIDLNMVSKEASLSPGLVMAAVKGNITLANLIEPDDTLVVDPDGALKLVFSRDSLIELTLDDLYDSFEPATATSVVPVTGSSITYSETIIIDPGDDVLIKEVLIIYGGIDIEIASSCSFDVETEFTISSATMGGVPLTYSMTIPAGEIVSDIIPLSCYTIDLTSDAGSPYNRLPVSYTIRPYDWTQFSLDDILTITASFAEPEFDYIKGYFGQRLEITEPDTINTGLEDIFSMITGSLYLANPSVTFTYSNSIGIPIILYDGIEGINAEETIGLNREPVAIEYPVPGGERDITSSFTIDRTNSELPDLLSMLPEWIVINDTLSMNTDGPSALDNILYGNSRITADIDIEVPFEFRMTNLQFSDTTENFLKGDDDALPDLPDEVNIHLWVDNGFPLAGEVSISLLDTLSNEILAVVTAGELFSAAQVDSEGRVISSTEHSTVIEFDKNFLLAAEEATSLIFTFTLNTTGGGDRDVRIFSDYTLSFKAGVSLSGQITLN